MLPLTLSSPCSAALSPFPSPCALPSALLTHTLTLPSPPHRRREILAEGEEVIRVGKLYLVDLAGSENISRCGRAGGRQGLRRLGAAALDAAGRASR